MNGWIKLHKKMAEWEWYKDTNTKALFIHLLLDANYQDEMYQGIVIHKGETITGLDKLSYETGLSVQNIRTSLKHLKLTNDITTKSTSKGTIIRIVNYDKYQYNDDAPNKQTNKQTNSQLTSKLTTPNNIKNIKNIYMGDLPTYDDSKNINFSFQESQELLQLMGKDN